MGNNSTLTLLDLSHKRAFLLTITMMWRACSDIGNLLYMHIRTDRGNVLTVHCFDPKEKTLKSERLRHYEEDPCICP
ncbi:hypothetical protein LPJ81_002175, partial [Coemansia sp. IMI 209127]